MRTATGFPSGSTAGQSLQNAGELTPVKTVAKPIIGELATAGLAAAAVSDMAVRTGCYAAANPELYQYAPEAIF